MLKKVESPNSLISTFRQSISNVITDCDVISCKNITSSEQDGKAPLQSNDLDSNKDSAKTLLDEDEENEDGDSENEETAQD